ncbi:25780_t:CDS:2, partial [Racocetra persica]
SIINTTKELSLGSSYNLSKEDDKMVNSYLDLIYGLLISDNNLENIEDNSDDSSSTSDNDNILTAGN